MNGLHILSFLDLQYKPVIMVDAIFGGDLVILISDTAGILTLVRWNKNDLGFRNCCIFSAMGTD